MGNLGNNRSNNRVRINLNGTGGLLIHFLTNRTRRLSLHLVSFGNNALHGTVPHRTFTAVTITTSGISTLGSLIGACRRVLGGRLTRGRGGLTLLLSSMTGSGTTLVTGSHSAFVHLLGTAPGNIVHGSSITGNIIRASLGINIIAVASGGMRVRYLVHSLVSDNGSCIIDVLSSLNGLTNTGARTGNTCPN